MPSDGERFPSRDMLQAPPTRADRKRGRVHHRDRARCLAATATRCPRRVLVGGHASLRRKRSDLRRSPFGVGRERDRSPGHQRPSSVVKQCRWSFQYGYSSSTKRPFSPNHVRRPRDRPVLLAQCLIVALSGRSAVLVGMSAHEAAADMSARAIRRPLMSHSGLLDIPPGKSGSEITISENRWIAGSPGLWPRPVPQRTSAMPVPRSHRAAGRTDLSAGRI